MMTQLYHEKQSRMRCGLHALNNLLQQQAFELSDLDAVADRLATASASAQGSSAAWSWTTRLWHPHRAPLGIGNYDVNVLMSALETRGLVMQWIDKRKAVTELPLDTALGVLCNVVSTNVLSAVWEQRHWFAIRLLQGKYFNLDSKLPEPKAFPTNDSVYEFLQELVNSGECELFLVTHQK